MKSLVQLFLLLIASMPNVSLGASFDCSKSLTFQEKLICNEPDLSFLDDKLARMYSAAVSDSLNRNEIKNAQKLWLQKVRNQCKEYSCLEAAYKKRIKELTPRQPDKLDVCPESEKEILGDWESVDGGFFEVMALEHRDSKREFKSWLHHIPEILGGTWKFEDCKLFVRHPTEESFNFLFTDVRIHKDRLFLREINDKTYAVYRRIKP